MKLACPILLWITLIGFLFNVRVHFGSLMSVPIRIEFEIHFRLQNWPAQYSSSQENPTILINSYSADYPFDTTSIFVNMLERVGSRPSNIFSIREEKENRTGTQKNPLTFTNLYRSDLLLYFPSRNKKENDTSSGQIIFPFFIRLILEYRRRTTGEKET